MTFHILIRRRFISRPDAGSRLAQTLFVGFSLTPGPCLAQMCFLPPYWALHQLSRAEAAAILVGGVRQVAGNMQEVNQVRSEVDTSPV
eukprot:3816396-Rhodomonas_salina.1